MFPQETTNQRELEMKSTKSAAALQRELSNLELMKAVQLKKR